MKKINKKIVRRLVCVASALVLAGGASAYYINKSQQKTIATIGAAKNDKPIIILDAGHGGIDGGCSSADGVPEKGINLNILLSLRDMFELYGYDVEVTRDTDRSIHDDGVEGIANQKSSDMDNRLALFNKYPNAICISIHQNQFTDPKYKGGQMFYSETNTQSKYIAQAIQDKFVEYIQPDNDREIKQCGKELFLCYFCNNPTVMVECGFLSNPEEAENLKNEEYQNKIAFSVFAAVNEYLSKK